ncbi:MAG: hypothetical protein RL077_5745 [Verrucomicrobiota bacterium]
MSTKSVAAVIFIPPASFKLIWEVECGWMVGWQKPWGLTWSNFCEWGT